MRYLFDIWNFAFVLKHNRLAPQKLKLTALSFSQVEPNIATCDGDHHKCPLSLKLLNINN